MWWVGAFFPQQMLLGQSDPTPQVYLLALSQMS